MVFFYGDNHLVDNILKRYILEKEDFILEDKYQKIIISVNKDSWPLPQKIMDILGIKKTYIFFDLNGTDQGFDLMCGNVVMIHFRSLSGIMENVMDRNLIPILGTPYCEIDLFLREIDRIFRLSPGTYHLMSGEIPNVNRLGKYFCRGEVKNYYNTKPVNMVIEKKGFPVFLDKKIVHIYIPTYYRFEKAKRCIQSIIEGVKISKHDCHVFIGDNNTKDDNLSKFLSEKKDDIEKVFYSNTNHGKSKMVNILHCTNTTVTYKPDYIFSIDSDMVMTPSFGEKINQFDGMIELLERGHNIGLVSSFQTGENQHWFGRGVEQKKERGYQIGESKTGIGIAGGCICMRTDDWGKIGGYTETYDIYTADDAIVMDKVDKILKKRAVVGMDFPFYHPSSSEDDAGYVKWKQERFIKDGLNFSERGYLKEEGMGKGYYD
jgi:hypothetical protein